MARGGEGGRGGQVGAGEDMRVGSVGGGVRGQGGKGDQEGTRREEVRERE